MQTGNSLVSDSVAAEIKNFTSSIDFAKEAEVALSESGDLELPEYARIESDIEVPSTWANEVPETKKVVVESQEAPKPSETIKFKANGEEIEISLEEAKQKLSLVEGSRQALQDRAKLSKELKELRKQAQELAEYKDTWEKLEAVKHDRKQLLELITGESYDDVVAREAERRELYRNGTDEQKQLLEYAERVQRLEREREVDQKRRDTEMTRIEQAKFDAERDRVKTAMEREYFKHKLPEGLDPAAQKKLGAMVWQQSVADLKSYYNQYGKITNKMVEKAFADNASLLTHSVAKSADKHASVVSEERKKQAVEKAQIASTRNYDSGDLSKLTGMNPNQLFDFFKKGKK
jgi:hypothetical protein